MASGVQPPVDVGLRSEGFVHIGKGMTDPGRQPCNRLRIDLTVGKSAEPPRDGSLAGGHLSIGIIGMIGGHGRNP